MKRPATVPAVALALLAGTVWLAGACGRASSPMTPSPVQPPAADRLFLAPGFYQLVLGGTFPSNCDLFIALELEIGRDDLVPGYVGRLRGQDGDFELRVRDAGGLPVRVTGTMIGSASPPFVIVRNGQAIPLAVSIGADGGATPIDGTATNGVASGVIRGDVVFRSGADVLTVCAGLSWQLIRVG